MKKKIVILLLTVVCAFGAIFAAACNNAGNGGNEKPKEEVTAPVDGTEEEIKNLQQQIADLQEQIKNLTGKVNDSETENKKLSDEIKKLEAENKKISDRLSVLEQQYYSGNFYTLQEAYDKGLLTQTDLLSIAYYHHSQSLYPNNGTAFNLELMGAGYHPIEKVPENLDFKSEIAIKQTLINYLHNENFSAPLDLKNIGIISYYGNYNGAIAIRMAYSDGEYGIGTDVIYKDIVEGITFYYSEYTEYFCNLIYKFDNTIMIWEENK